MGIERESEIDCGKNGRAEERKKHFYNSIYTHREFRVNKWKKSILASWMAETVFILMVSPPNNVEKYRAIKMGEQTNTQMSGEEQRKKRMCIR